MSRPEVSVVIPSFRRQDETIRAVRSVMLQTGIDFEVLVVDDASPEPLQVPTPLLADARMRLIRLAENGGPAAARNAGVEASRGAYIAFLDSDDFFLPRQSRTAVDLAARPGGRPTTPGGRTRLAMGADVVGATCGTHCRGRCRGFRVRLLVFPRLDGNLLARNLEQDRTARSESPSPGGFRMGPAPGKVWRGPRHFADASVCRSALPARWTCSGHRGSPPDRVPIRAGCAKWTSPLGLSAAQRLSRARIGERRLRREALRAVRRRADPILHLTAAAGPSSDRLVAHKGRSPRGTGLHRESCDPRRPVKAGFFSSGCRCRRAGRCRLRRDSCRSEPR